MKLLLILLSILSFSPLAAQISKSETTMSVTSGKLDHYLIHSPELDEQVKIDVWTPNSYAPGASYPVIYMHDGQNLFDASHTWNNQAWEVDSIAGKLIKNEQIKPVIIVGIHSVDSTRVGDLMPRQPFEAIAKEGIPADIQHMFRKGLRGDRYVTFIAKTLKPAIDSLYSTLPDPASTFIMGSSMGGLASIYAMCEYPQVFGGAACLSTHWSGLIKRNEIFPPAMSDYLTQKLPRDSRHKLYMDNGDQDIDWVYIPYFHRFNNLATSLGYNRQRLMTPFFEGQGHNENAWKSRLHQPLLFLLPPEPQN